MSGETPSRRYTYCPPARGNIPASSVKVSAPSTVMIPESPQTSKSKPGLWTCLTMSAETMKIPEPIMEPTTSAVASRRDSARTKSVRSVGVLAMVLRNMLAVSEPAPGSNPAQGARPSRIRSLDAETSIYTHLV